MPAVLDFAAALAEASRSDLLADPYLMSAALDDFVRLFPVDGILVTLRPDELSLGFSAPGSAERAALTNEVGSAVPPAVEVCTEAMSRLRDLHGDRVGLGVLLPGPATVAAEAQIDPSEDALERIVTRLLALCLMLEPPKLDVLGVLETVPLGDAEVELLGRALSPLWNAIGFYSMPSLFEAASAGPAVGNVGASAVGVWSPESVEGRVAGGASQVASALRPPESVPAQPEAGTFFGTAGELPADTDVEWLQAVATATAALRPNAAGSGIDTEGIVPE